MTTDEKIEIQYLLTQYLDGKATPEQAVRLSACLRQHHPDIVWTDLLEELMMAEEPLLAYDPGEWQTFIENLRYRISTAGTASPRVVPLRRWAWVAASLVFLLAAAGLFLLRNTPSLPDRVVTVAHEVDVAPGSSGAILTLSGGETVVLDSLGNGTVAVQNGTHVQIRNGRLVYDPSGDAANAIAFNTVSTPPGRQYQLQLPDGTQAWLNAGSSIRYPTRFAGKERNVSITGEVYFEVAGSPSRIFTVQIDNKATVQVLGTHFNIMAYRNEPEWQTTLLEGKVKFLKGDASVLLKPGEQSRLRENGRITVEKNVDVQTVVAWKNGLQAFRGADLAALMRKVERWYNIRIILADNLPQRTFSGDIPRSASLGELLKLFEINNIHFEFDKEQKELTIIP